MDDEGYLEETQEEAGTWPTNEEQEEIRKQMRENIDNDPRPETARPAEDFYPVD